MGNQILIPSQIQIQSVESYLLDLKDTIQFKSSLGSTTFMKTARVTKIENSALDDFLIDNRLVAALNSIGFSDAASVMSTQISSNIAAAAAIMSNQAANLSTSPTLANANNINYQQQQRQQILLLKQKLQQLREMQQQVVVKVFPKYDSSIRHDLYIKRVREIKKIIYSRYGLCTNCLPYSELILTEKAAFIFRQYIKYNLYDRLSTRPFFTNIEKKWIAFQLLCAVNEIHSLQIVHGDIKTENVLINSFLWCSLADFASYKPVYLSKNHPSADFNYYFDISRRRTCYLAPERLNNSPREKIQTNSPLQQQQQPTQYDASEMLNESMPPDPNDFKSSMDIFSLGCVLAELFMERPLFDFASLLAYRERKYDPVPELTTNINDKSILDMILSMISLEASERKSANEYLQEQNEKSFPSYFVFLRNYISLFIRTGLNDDDIVIKIKSDLPLLLKNLKLNINENDSNLNSNNSETNNNSNSSNGNNANTNNSNSASITSNTAANNSQHTNDAFLILLSLLLSCVRKLKFAENKLIAIDLMGNFSKFLDDSIILDRILPYYLHLAEEQQLPMVKSHVVYALNDCLANIYNIDLQNLNIFPEIIFNMLETLSKDESYLVRSAVAKSISNYALTSLRFLDNGFLTKRAFINSHNNSTNEQDVDLSGAGGTGKSKLSTTYDKEYEHYQTRVTEIVMHLITDINQSSTSNAVKEALIRSDISKLCTFFSRQKTSDFLLPHMITILNEKTDWSVRAAFFDALCPVLFCIGWESVEIVKPLLEQGLRDSEEFVIYRTLITLARMVEIGLLDRHQIIYFLSNHIAPLLCHPSLWIRHGAVNYIVIICKQTKLNEANINSHSSLNTADILCSVVPILSKFLQPTFANSLFSFTKNDVLFSCLKNPVKRAVYDCISQDGRSDQLFIYLNQRSEIRCLTNQNYLPGYVDCSDPNVQQFFERLCKLGFVEEDEDKLLHMKEFIDKIRISRLSSSQHNTDLSASNNSNTSVLNAFSSSSNLKDNFSVKDGFISIMKFQRCNYENLDKRSSQLMYFEQKQSIETTSPESGVVPRRDTVVDQYQVQQQNNESNYNAEWKLMFGKGNEQPENMPKNQKRQSITPYEQNTSNLSQSPSSNNRFSQAPPNQRNPNSILNNSRKYTDCTIEVEKYLDRCKFIYEEDRIRQSRVARLKETINSSISSNVISLSSSIGKWKPKGLLIAHSNEHTKEITKISRNFDSSYFSTCSPGEASVKIWSTDNVLDGKSGFFKSIFTYDRSVTNANGSSNILTPVCTSFYDKNSLAILSEDFRFYIIDFNSNRTQYKLFTHEKIFRTNTCRNFGLNSNTTQFNKTTFYYLNKAYKNTAFNLKCGTKACYCAENYPIDMIYLNDSSPTWPYSATNSYEYFKGSNSRGLFVYSTSMGDVNCIDIRTRSKVFDLKRDLQSGYVTTMITDPFYTWLALGTSYGRIDVYDFRFMLPVTSFDHRNQAAVSRLCNHPLHLNKIVASYQSNNEIAVWNMDPSSSKTNETSQPQHVSKSVKSLNSTPEFVFWGVQSVPPLCQNKMSKYYITSMVACSAGYDVNNSSAALICSSTDMKLRYIDLLEPNHSQIISSPFNNTQNMAAKVSSSTAGSSQSNNSEFASSLMNQNAQYETRQIEGNKVLVELDQQSNSSSTFTNTGVSPTFSLNSSALTHQTYFTYHQDAITDLSLCYNYQNAKSQPLIISSSRDGVLKVWR